MIGHWLYCCNKVHAKPKSPPKKWTIHVLLGTFSPLIIFFLENLYIPTYFYRHPRPLVKELRCVELAWPLRESYVIHVSVLKLQCIDYYVHVMHIWIKIYKFFFFGKRYVKFIGWSMQKAYMFIVNEHWTKTFHDNGHYTNKQSLSNIALNITSRT